MTPDLAIAALGRTVEVERATRRRARQLRREFGSGFRVAGRFCVSHSSRMVRGDLFENAQDAIRFMRLCAGIGRCILEMEMHFGPEKYGLLRSRRRRCEIVLLRSGFAAAVEKLPSLAAKRRCDQHYRRGNNL